jgi:peroxiredoxin
MKTKHTPGPWTAKEALQYKGIGWSSSIHANDEFLTDSWGDTKQQAEANARLIAAAPDLLKALQWLLEDADDRGEIRDDDGELYDDWKNAIAAIKKAQEG